MVVSAEAVRVGAALLSLSLVSCGAGGAAPSRLSREAPSPARNRQAEQAGQTEQAGLPIPADAELHATHPAFAVESDDPMWGSPEAPVSVVIHGSVYAKDNGAPLVRRLRAAYPPERLRVALKHCEDALDPVGMRSAIAAQSVLRLKGADAFLSFVEQLSSSANAKALSDPDRARRLYDELAAPLGIDSAALRAEMTQPVVASSVRRDSLWPDGEYRCHRRVLVNGLDASGYPEERFDADLAKKISEAEARAADARAKGVAPNRFHADAVRAYRRGPLYSDPPPPPYYALTWAGSVSRYGLQGPTAEGDPLLARFSISHGPKIVAHEVIPELSPGRFYLFFGACSATERDAWLEVLKPSAPNLAFVPAAELPHSCPSMGPEYLVVGDAVTVRTKGGVLSVQLIRYGESGDFGLATLTDDRGRVLSRVTFADEDCGLDAPSALPDGKLVVEGTCITSRCGAAPQLSRMTFDVSATAGKGIDVNVTEGEVVQECGGE